MDPLTLLIGFVAGIVAIVTCGVTGFWILCWMCDYEDLGDE